MPPRGPVVQKSFCENRCCGNVESCYFLVPEQESNQRSRFRRGAELIAPAIKSRPLLAPPPARIYDHAEKGFGLIIEFLDALSYWRRGFARGAPLLEAPLGPAPFLPFLPGQESNTPLIYRTIHFVLSFRVKNHRPPGGIPQYKIRIFTKI